MDEDNREQQPPIMNNEEPAEKAGIGALVGTLIIILLLALGAFYFWGSRLNTGNENPPPLILGNDEASAIPESDSSAGLPSQQESDDADAISADIEAMNMQQLESETANSQQSFGAEVQ